MSPLEKLVRGTVPPLPMVQIPDYHYVIGNEGRIAVSVCDFKLSGIFDTNEFAESRDRFPNWLSPIEHDIASKFEGATMHEFKSLVPRIYSGMPPYFHIVMDAVEAMRISNSANIPLDFVILLAIIGHDRIEDSKDVKQLLIEWKQAALNGNHALRTNAALSLSEARERKRDAILRELMGYISGNVAGQERTDLEGQIQEAVYIIYGLTRFSDQDPYAFSVGDQYTQMKFLSAGRTQSVEHPKATFKRMIAKDADRISNMIERGMLVEPSVMRYIVKVFNAKDELGHAVRELYGPIKYTKDRMPEIVQARMAFESMYPLHFGNETFNYLAPQILGTLVGSRTADLMRLAIEGHRKMGKTTLALIDSATEGYEKFKHIRRLKPRIDVEVEDMRHTQFNHRIDIDGPARDWLLRDPWSKGDLERFDSYKFNREENYRALRLYRGVVERLLLPDNTGNPDQKFPTMDRETVDALRTLSKNYYKIVYEYWRKFERILSGRNSKIGMMSL